MQPMGGHRLLYFIKYKNSTKSLVLDCIYMSIHISLYPGMRGLQPPSSPKSATGSYKDFNG